MLKYQRIILSLYFILFLSGCANRENVQIPQTFFSKPNAVIITQLSGLEEPGYYKEGSQGLVDFAISHLITEDMREQINSLNPSPTLDDYFYTSYGNYLKSKSFTVKLDKEPLNKKNLASFSNEERNCAPYDFRFLRQKTGTDYALVLDPHAFGVIRNYYSFVPISRPKGYAHLSIYLVNLTDNSIVSEYGGIVREEVEGDWDTPPHYTALLTSSKKALAKALSDGYVFLFQ